MKISIQRSGGLAGLLRKALIDSQKLSTQEATNLVRLVEEAGFFSLPRKISSPRPQPDRFQYEITASEGKKAHTVVVSEEAMPAGLASLVTWLLAASELKK